MPPAKAHVIFWPLAVGGLALDLWSKSAVFARLEEREVLPIIDGIVQFIAAENRGAAWGIAYGQRTLLVSVSAVALVVILGVFFGSRIRDSWMPFILGLLAGGVSGNLYDRVFNDGAVRDFIDVVYWPGRHWPAFNVADSMLCIAVGLLLITHLFISPKSDQKRDRQRK